MGSLSLQTLMFIGAIGTIVIVFLAIADWRRAVYAALIVALFEGAVRKWIFPQASELVYFLKDVILLGAYIKFFMFPDPDVRAWKLHVPVTLIAVVVVTLIAVGALNPNIGSLMLAGYGLKIYLWYLPLGFMIPMLFKNEVHMTSMLFRYSLLSIPICLLGAAQFVAGPGSPLNVYATSDLAGVQNVATFGAGGQSIARITGTFSYISGHSVFVQFFFILSLALLTGINDKRRWVLLLGNIPLLLANGMMAGSRSAVFTMLLVGVAIGLTSSVTKVGKGKNAFIYFILGTAVAVIGISVFFEKAYLAFETRRKTADDKVSSRVFHPINAVIYTSQFVDISGFGIGTSHPATAGLRRAFGVPPPEKPCPLSDSETGQVLGELGWVGFIMWYSLRLMMLYQCWDAYRRSPPSMYKSLALGFFCYVLFLMPSSFILNHTANIFGCAAWGYCLIPRLQPRVNRIAASPNSLRRASPSQLPYRGSKPPASQRSLPGSR